MGKLKNQMEGIRAIWNIRKLENANDRNVQNSLNHILHLILIGIVKIDRIKRRQKIVIINPLKLNALKEITSPILFAPTHCGKYDIQVMAEVLGIRQWALLSGDPHELPGTIEGVWLQLNGVIYVDRDDDIWRHCAKKEMIELLKNGKNILIFPEGTWNFSENQPVLPLFRGVVDAARAANALIVPFAMEIDDSSNTYYVNVGEPMCTMDLLSLRDAMATLKWEIWENSSLFHEYGYSSILIRSKWEQYITKRLSECNYMDFNLIWKYAYRDKGSIMPADVFAHLQQLIPSKENAFLLRKKYEIPERKCTMQSTNKKMTGFPSIDKPWLKYYSQEVIDAP